MVASFSEEDGFVSLGLFLVVIFFELELLTMDFLMVAIAISSQVGFELRSRGMHIACQLGKEIMLLTNSPEIYCLQLSSNTPSNLRTFRKVKKYPKAVNF